MENKVIIYLVLKDLKYDKISLYSCLLINRTWCKMTLPILWNDPIKLLSLFTKTASDKSNILFNKIVLHLTEESKNNLKKQGINLFKNTYYQQPLFNYISFWKHMDLYLLECMIKKAVNYEESKIINLGKEILDLFNKYTRFVSLSIQSLYHIDITGGEHCFSELKYFNCSSEVFMERKASLERLAIINKSIKKLKYIEFDVHNSGINRLIEVQRNLSEVDFTYHPIYSNNPKIFEESLIKCSNTIQYLKINWKPFSNFLSYLVNLVSLDISYFNDFDDTNWNPLEEVSLPILKFLKTENISAKFLTSLVKTTKGNLIEIDIFYKDTDDDDGSLLQAIYQNCPNLSYLQLTLNNWNISEFENVLVNCQYLMGLVVGEYFEEYYDSCYSSKFNWDKLLKILIRSSPIGLFRFKFRSEEVKDILEALSSFLGNWNDRHSILLHAYSAEGDPKKQQLKDLLQSYKVKGIIIKYETCGGFENFEWIKEINWVLYYK